MTVGSCTRHITALLFAALVGGLLGGTADAAVAASPAAEATHVGTSARATRTARLTLATPRGVVARDVLVASVAVRAPTSRGIVGPRGWRRVRGLGRRAGRLGQALYVRVTVAGEPGSHTWRFRARRGGVGGLLAYRGIDPARPVLAHRGVARQRARTITPPPVRVSAPGAVVVAFLAATGRGRTSPPGGMRERFDLRKRGRLRVTAAGADAVQNAARVARRAPARLRARRSLAFSQLVVLRPKLSGAPSPGGGAGAALPAPLPASTGATFYVATSGSDSNPGTAAAPWRTIQKALNTLTAGQRAVVRAGTYTENARMSRAGTAAAPITVENHPGERPVLASAGGHPLEVAPTAAYFRLRGFTVQGYPGLSGGNIDIYGDHIEISATEVRGSNNQGIYTEEDVSSFVHLLGNWIHHNGVGRSSGQQAHGIYFQGTDHVAANNVIHDHPWGFGIQVYRMNHRSFVVNNTIVESGQSGIVVGGAGGVRDITIRNNVVAFNDRWGISFDDACPTANVVIDHNVIYGNACSPPIENRCAPAVRTAGGNTFGDPLFVNYAARNLRVQAASPAVGRALPEHTPGTDFDGVGRPQGPAPDAGAFER